MSGPGAEAGPVRHSRGLTLDNQGSPQPCSPSVYTYHYLNWFHQSRRDPLGRHSPGATGIGGRRQCRIDPRCYFYDYALWLHVSCLALEPWFISCWEFPARQAWALRQAQGRPRPRWRGAGLRGILGGATAGGYSGAALSPPRASKSFESERSHG